MNNGNGNSRVEAIGAIVISALVHIGFDIALVLAALGKLPEGQTMGMIIGAVTMAYGTVNGYWVGSSRGSKSKDDHLAAARDQLANSVPANAIPTIIPMAKP